MKVRYSNLAVAALVSLPAAANAGIYETLLSLSGDANGAAPRGQLAHDGNGTLYGVTFSGGSGCASQVGGCGTVYKVDSSGVETVLVAFDSTTNGDSPLGPVTLIGRILYGTAHLDGPGGHGTLFSVHADGTRFRILHAFSGLDGIGPGASIVPGPNGVLYGITVAGGATYQHANAGVIYQYGPDGTYKRLYNFTGKADGSGPSSLSIDAAGTLYGTTDSNETCSGCAVVFRFVPSTGVFTVLHSFTRSEGLQSSVGSIGPDGTVYGTSYNYGPNGAGSLWELTPASGYALKTLFAFGGHHPSVDPGELPSGGPVLTSSGALIGTTAGDNGSLWKYKFNRMSVLYRFPANVYAEPVSIGKAGAIVGTTLQGGVEPCNVDGEVITTGCGTVWSYGR